MTEDWLKSSIMAKRALAKGATGTTHSLTIEQQGGFHYVYGPYAKPTLSIDPGGVVVVETEDAFGGVLTSESDSPTAKLNFPLSEPAMRTDRGQRRQEGRLPRRLYPRRRDPRRAAGRNDLHHSGVRRPGRDRIHGAAQSAAAGTRQEAACRPQRRALERQDHAAL
ncbi:hypothetical protein ACVMDO_005387 [Bradyrhizobium sp. USDA 4513]